MNNCEILIEIENDVIWFKRFKKLKNTLIKCENEKAQQGKFSA